MKKTTSVSIGLCNPKSPDNVNSVRRAAGNYRVDSIFYSGDRYDRALKNNPNMPNINRDVSLHIPIVNVIDLIKEKPVDLKIVCVEFAEGAISLPKFQHPDNAFYIFGPEDGNVSQEIINHADAVVYIPTVGCMNLAATVNVLLYDRLSKSSDDFDSSENIKQNRDQNNNLKVPNRDC